ncbi:uroporphyrinogen decarboxylase [Thermodesulfovibrio yellowstonii]|uniref:uroporphyrinogen decarboxylase n=1 Tax=Thermodesulfovibrio yellowstonii TaxID=28262 RepID=UPI0024908378|nr:uroporphyrinogen decarboxylase [Thermodesulfovibrio islandicus]
MKEVFLKACRGIRTDYTPVWFMRQAGRYMPEYQKIRQKYDFLTMCKTPEIAAEVTLQPVKVLGVDAAILFSDILIPLEAIGLKVEFIEEKGPRVSPNIRTVADLKFIGELNLEKIDFVFEAIRILIKELNVPLIGFAASPFTLATYVIEGGSTKEFLNTKRFMFLEPEGFHKLMSLFTSATLKYLNEQIKTGVHAVQIFDTWAGILSPFDYEIFVKPYVKRLIESLKTVPVIYFSSNTAGLINHLKELNSDVLSIDWRIDIKDATDLLKDQPLQGNLDPLTLLGTEEELFKRAEKVLIGARGAKSHIFNLGHGVNINTSVDKLKKLVDFVHEFKFMEG